MEKGIYVLIAEKGKEGRVNRMIKVKAFANYGFAGTDMEFEEEFTDGTPDEEIEETMREIVVEKIDWSWKKVGE